MVVSLRWFNLVIGVLILVAALAFPVQQRQGRSIEEMFGSRDPSVQAFREIKEIFGDRETILVVYRDPSLFSPDQSGLKRLQNLSQQIEALDQVQEVLSLKRLQDAIQVLGPVSNPLQAITNQTSPTGIMDPDNRLAQAFLETFDGWTHDRSQNLAVLVCLIESPARQADPEQTGRTVQQMREIVSDLPEAHVVGEPVMVEDGLAYLKEDGRWLQFGAMILLGLVILLVLRTIKWLIVTACVVAWSNIVTVWVLGLLSFEQTMISSLLGSIIAVIGVATTIHLVVGYRIRREAGDSRSQAMRQSVSLLLPPIFWACMTDAAGFVSLSVANVHAVQGFGQMMAIASLVTFTSICLLTPGLILIGPRETAQATGIGQRNLEGFLTRLQRWVHSYYRQVSVTALSLGLIATLGCLYLKVETDFTQNFRENTPIMEGYRFVETEFGGAGLIDIAIETPRKLDPEFLAKVERFQDELRQIRAPIKSPSADGPATIESGRPLLAKVLSQVDAIKTAQSVPALRLLPADTIVTGMRQVLPGFTNHWYRWDSKQKVGYLRIFARTRQQQNASSKRFLISEIRRLSDQYFGDGVTIDRPATPQDGDDTIAQTDHPPYLVTGMFVLLTRLVDSLLEDHLATTITASAAIALLLWVALRNLRYALIALVPNVFPILIILGVMGWLGIALNMGVAMIAAVSIGLSVDSSIHYLWPLVRRRQNAEESYPIASLSTQQQQTRIGTALTYSSLTLIVGFLSLTKSDFVPTVFFGSLVSAAMLGGLLGNLVLLPALLRFVSASPAGKR